MKKLLLFVCSFLVLFTLAGCHNVNELSKAKDELEQGNYTAYYEVYSKTVDNKKVVDEQKSELLVKHNGGQTFTSTWDETGRAFKTYTEVTEEGVELYKTYGKVWAFNGVKEQSEIEDPEAGLIPEVELSEKYFTYERGTWVGKGSEIAKLLEDYFDPMIEDLQYGRFNRAEPSVRINAYNIELDELTLSEVLFDYDIIFTFEDGTEYVVSQVVELEYSDVNSTVVSKPENVSMLSSAIMPDNFTGELTLVLNVESGPNPDVEEIVKFDIYQDGKATLLVSEISDGYNLKIFTEEVDGEVVVYQDYGEGWELGDSVDISEINDLTTIPEIELSEEYFTFDSGLWKGDTEKITDLLGDYIDEAMSMMGDTFGLDLEAKVLAYEIILDGQYISDITFGIQFRLNDDDYYFRVIEYINLSMTNFGKTEVERPVVE